MKIAVGGDHKGFPLKAMLIDRIRALGHDVTDFGCFDENPVDFPDIAGLVCNAILSGNAQRGIMFCGSGVGAAIACNKTAGIRAAVCHDLFTAHQCVEHDDVQVIAFGAQIIGYTAAFELIRLFLDAEFSTDGDFRRRVSKLERMDAKRSIEAEQ